MINCLQTSALLSELRPFFNGKKLREDWMIKFGDLITPVPLQEVIQILNLNDAIDVLWEFSEETVKSMVISDILLRLSDVFNKDGSVTSVADLFERRGLGADPAPYEWREALVLVSSYSDWSYVATHTATAAEYALSHLEPGYSGRTPRTVAYYATVATRDADNEVHYQYEDFLRHMR